MMSPAEFKLLRKQIGTQQEVADLLGVSMRSIWSMENDPEAPRRELYVWALRGLIASRGAPDQEQLRQALSEAHEILSRALSQRQTTAA